MPSPPCPTPPSLPQSEHMGVWRLTAQGAQPFLSRLTFGGCDEAKVRRNAASQLRYNSAANETSSRYEKLFLATTVAAPSYGVETLRLSCCRLSATRTSQISETGPPSGPISPFPQDSRPPPPAIAWAHIHSAPSSNWSPSACQPQRNPLGLLFPTHLGGIWYGCHWSGHR